MSKQESSKTGEGVSFAKLCDDIIIELLKPHKTIRDPVHGDVYITHLETAIVDTLDFQRLRRLKQLGLTNLVFPSANHTRLEHSIGTLFLSDLIVHKINKNPFAEFRIDKDDLFIIRLCALLHDAGNIPYDHTLSDEGGIFGKQWSDERLNRFLGKNSDIGKVILSFGTLKALAEMKHKRLTPEKVLEEVRAVLKCIDVEKRPEDLERPYIADIVGNTLCADLLDYTKRDPYFTGIVGAYDPRVLSYLYIAQKNGKKRLVLRLIKPSTEEIRRDVLSELIDLLRLRYSLAEKVYYHHAKIIVSAMLISAVNSMVQEGKLSEDSLFDQDDNTLLNHLKVEGTPTAKNLAKCILERKLYKIVYDLSYSSHVLGSSEAETKSKIIAQLHNPKFRQAMEKTLEEMSSSSETIRKTPGSIIIYCPEKKMGAKEIETLVDYGKDIIPLKEIDDPRIKGEIETSILAKHRELWKMYVIVNSDIAEPERLNINGDCQQIFGLPSASEKYRSTTHTHYIDRYVSRWTLENHNAPAILATEVASIKSKLPTRYKNPPKDILSYSNFCDTLNDIRTTGKG